ncbi:MAG: FAD-binding oxidoreductase [Thiohalorhabdus sp.]|uniref:FAD-binding oxidoreductase n=1 Tax=Thiohalorhabdus sp. TaxID=3094134 RepID=UPI00397EE0C6
METLAGKTIEEQVGAEALEAFVGGFHGEPIRPGDADYDGARRIWNGMIDRHPALIARCRGTPDVMAAVDLAREHGVPLAVRGGGHNVAGSSLCDGGLVIDLSAMNGVWVDPGRRLARVQGGATLGDVDRETQLYGLATPLGVVSATGVAGLTLNGGLGHLRRRFGLSCDNLEAVEMVTADGRPLRASPEEHPDLFWAVRGGGGNFGVVTAFEYRLHPVGPEVFALFVWHAADAEGTAMRRFREWSQGAPREASVVAVSAFVPELDPFPRERWGQPCYAFLGTHYGTLEEAADVLQPLRAGSDPVADFSGPLRYTELQSLLDADYPDGLSYYWKAAYLDELSEPVLELIARRSAESPSPLTTIDVWHLGGALAEVPPDATAFWHRDKPYMLTIEANWEDPAANDRNLAWARETFAELQALEAASGGYGNFPGLGEDPAQTLFGDNYERLAEVKGRYDPGNLFRMNQNIRPQTGEKAPA